MTSCLSSTCQRHPVPNIPTIATHAHAKQHTCTHRDCRHPTCSYAGCANRASLDSVGSSLHGLFCAIITFVPRLATVEAPCQAPGLGPSFSTLLACPTAQPQSCKGAHKRTTACLCQNPFRLCLPMCFCSRLCHRPCALSAAVHSLREGHGHGCASCPSRVTAPARTQADTQNMRPK